MKDLHTAKLYMEQILFIKEYRGCGIMGIFSKLVSKVKSESNVDIALQLFESQGIGDRYKG